MDTRTQTHTTRGKWEDHTDHQPDGINLSLAESPVELLVWFKDMVAHNTKCLSEVINHNSVRERERERDTEKMLQE